MRAVQPSSTSRVAFAAWALRAEIPRQPDGTWLVPYDTEIPAGLLLGATVDGKLLSSEPKRTGLLSTFVNWLREEDSHGGLSEAR